LQDIVKKSFIDSNLQVLEDRKYYLQLNKISGDVMIELLSDYLRESLEPNKEYIVNSVLDSYLNRTKIDPNGFFQ
jgi:hypothetical protein